MPPTISTEFGAWLRERRKQLGMSQGDAAKRAGISRQQWLRIEAAESGTRRETIPGIAFALSVPVAEAMERAGYSASFALEEARELEMILSGVPPGKRRALLRAFRAMAETVTIT
jgi:transcriptional regulator with XRE-family HTH domain